MARGIHLRYLGDDLRVVPGVGVFQKGTVAWAPRDVAVRLLSGPDFVAVADGPTAQAFIVHVGQAERPPEAPSPRPPADEPADFERELEEEERRLAETARDGGRGVDEAPSGEG